MTRRRSEYRLAPISIDGAPVGLDVSAPVEGDRGALAELLLAAYRGTVDDEGEDAEDARSALDRYFEVLIRPHSLVVSDGGIPVAFSFVVVVGGLYYIDPVVVAPHRKRAGVGSDVVRRSLRSLASAGVDEVGATITDGNEASEALFGRLGFVRHGPWPPRP